jgi:tetratricopeptide (TPR) repeat protein
MQKVQQENENLTGGKMNKQTASCSILVISLVLLLTAVIAQPLVAQTKKGVELCTNWQFKEAEKVLREAVKANPRDIEAGYYLGIAVLMQDKHSEALQIFQKVLVDKDRAGKQAKPTAPDAYQIQIALARTRLELKQNDEAMKNLEAAKKVRANGIEISIYRGLYYLNLGNEQKAVVELEKAIAQDKNDAYAHYYAGLAYLRAGNPARAVELLKQFLQLTPRAPEAEKAKTLIDALC